MYPEPASYEEYVPNHWIGVYEDFTNLVPTNQTFWINHKGKKFIFKKIGEFFMNSNDTVTMLNEEFENDQTGEKVEGITIIVDGQFKQVLDIIKAKSDSYENYTEIIRDALFEGVNSMTMKLRNKE